MACLREVSRASGPCLSFGFSFFFLSLTLPVCLCVPYARGCLFAFVACSSSGGAILRTGAQQKAARILFPFSWPAGPARRASKKRRQKTIRGVNNEPPPFFPPRPFSHRQNRRGKRKKDGEKAMANTGMQALRPGLCPPRAAWLAPPSTPAPRTPRGIERIRFYPFRLFPLSPFSFPFLFATAPRSGCFVGRRPPFPPPTVCPVPFSADTRKKYTGMGLYSWVGKNKRR